MQVAHNCLERQILSKRCGKLVKSDQAKNSKQMEKNVVWSHDSGGHFSVVLT